MHEEDEDDNVYSESVDTECDSEGGSSSGEGYPQARRTTCQPYS